MNTKFKTLIAGVAVFLFATLFAGVQNVSAQVPTTDQYYSGTVYRVPSGFFVQEGCKTGSVACINGKQQGRAKDLGLEGVEFYNELTRGLVNIKTLSANEVVAYDAGDLNNIWLPDCNIRVWTSKTKSHWEVRPNRLKRVTPPAEVPNRPTTGTITVLKEAFDQNGNKLEIVPPFTFILDGQTQLTNASDGKVVFNNIAAGSHTITEVVPEGWEQKLVTPLGGAVVVTAGQNVGVVFKNQQKPLARTTVSNPVPLPYCTISVNPTEIKKGKDVTISWTSNNAVSAIIMNQEVGLSGSNVLSNVEQSTLIAMIVKNSEGKEAQCSAQITVKGSQGIGLCEVHRSFWGRVIDLASGGGSGFGTGWATQGKIGWGSAIGAGAGGLVAWFKGPCWGAFAGGVGGQTGWIWRGGGEKPSYDGQRRDAANSNQTGTGIFVPATTTTPNPIGPPKIISVTPVPRP